MKKLILLILSAVLIFSGIPCMDVEAADINKQAGKAYADIIQNYLEVFESIKNDPDNADWGNSNINPEFGGASHYSWNEAAIYRIMDYNSDGIPELFIGLDSGTIYDVYTFYNGKAVQLMEDIGYRAGTCILCKNGIIKDMWSGSAFNSGVKFHKLKKNKLSTVIELEYDSFSTTKPTIYTKKVNGKTTNINQNQYKRLYKKYDKPIEVTFYKVNSKAIRNIRKGTFTYKNQKKWNLKTGEKTDW